MARPASVPGRRLQPAFSFAPTTRNAHGTLPSTSNQSLMTCSARAEQTPEVERLEPATLAVPRFRVSARRRSTGESSRIAGTSPSTPPPSPQHTTSGRPSMDRNWSGVDGTAIKTSTSPVSRHAPRQGLAPQTSLSPVSVHHTSVQEIRRLRNKATPPSPRTGLSLMKAKSGINSENIVKMLNEWTSRDQQWRMETQERAVAKVEVRRAAQRVYKGERTMLENRCRDLEDQLSQRDTEVKELQQLTEGLRAELSRCDEKRNSLQEELDQAQRESRGPCVICLDEIAQYAVVPCGHLAICSQCCLGESGTCPVCRRRSMGLLRIFIP